MKEVSFETVKSEQKRVYTGSDYKSLVESLALNLSKTPFEVLYSSKLRPDTLQKIRISSNEGRFESNHKGIVNHYLVMPAVGKELYFQRHAVHDGQLFEFCVPFKAWNKMFQMAFNAEFYRLLQQVTSKTLLEIHFFKPSRFSFKLVYCGFIDFVERKKTQFGFEDVYTNKRDVYKRTELFELKKPPKKKRWVYEEDKKDEESNAYKGK